MNSYAEKLMQIITSSIWMVAALLTLLRLSNTDLSKAISLLDLKLIGLHIPLLFGFIVGTARQYLINNKQHSAAKLLDEAGRVIVHWVLAFGVSIVLTNLFFVFA